MEANALNNINPNVSIQPNYIADLFFNNMVISKLGNIMNNDCQLTPINIAKYLLLMSSGEIKSLMSKFIQYIFETSKNFPFAAYLWISKLCKKKKIKQKNIMEIAEKKNYDITINIDDTFMNLLYKYIAAGKNVKSNQNIIEYQVKNIKDIIVNKQFNNIEIQIDNHLVEIRNSVIFGNNKITDEVENYIINNYKKNCTNNVAKYTALFTQDQVCVLNEIKEKINWGDTYEEVVKYITDGNIPD